MLADRVREAVRRHALLAPGDRVLVALSGGADSTALLHVLHDLRGELGIDLAAAHLDHALRSDSADDARSAAEAARRLKIPIRVERLAWEAGTEVSEDLARRARYDFLARAAAAVGAKVVATGHHADDQVETILMRLLRGAGPPGLAGMPAARPLVASTGDAPPVRLVRPFLEATREEIRAYLCDRRIPFREDPSNADERYERNRVRRRLIPFLLEHFDPRLRERLRGLAEVLRDEDDFVRAAAEEAYARLVRRTGGRLEFSWEGVRALPPALRRRVLRAALREAAGGRAEPDRVHVEMLLDLVEEGRTGARLDLPGGVAAARSYETVALGPDAGVGAPVAQDERPGPIRCEIALPGETVVAPLGLVVEATIYPRAGVVPLRHGDRTAVFDADAVRPPLIVRTRLPGDRIDPLGMRGTKKLQDLFVDAKVPKGARDRTPVVADAEGVIWVVGVREGARCRVRRSTRRCLRLEVRDLPSAEPRGGLIA